MLRTVAHGVALPEPFDGVPEPLDPDAQTDAEARLRGAGVLDDERRCHPSVAASLLCHETADVTIRIDRRLGDEVCAVRAAVSGLLASQLSVTLTTAADGVVRWVSPVTLTTSAVDDLVAGLTDDLLPGPAAGDRAPWSLRPDEGHRATDTLSLRIGVPRRGREDRLVWVHVDGAWWEPLARPEPDGVHLDLSPVDGRVLAERLRAALTRRLAAEVGRG